MRRLGLLTALLLSTVLPLLPAPALASLWGSPYGDPAGFCPAESFLPATYATVVTNDPQVGSNPEQDTFWGIHRYPGYDDWYGYWYGDFRGSSADDSGWRYITTSYYGGAHGHWNFGSWGWAVHGHAKQYVAYYNWTFGGQCEQGSYGLYSPPPYMADVYGNPVVDIYVDSVAPEPPRPRVVAVSPTSVTFTWDPVADLGDGAGPDYWASGFDHFSSWLTVNGGAPQQQATTAVPRTLTAAGLGAGIPACVHVVAADRLGNHTAEQVQCASPMAAPPPPMPPAPPEVHVAPAPVGLTGLDAWLWLAPSPHSVISTTKQGGIAYTITATPVSVAWIFGDADVATLPAPGGFGVAYPARSSVTHVYQRESGVGYRVSATVNYALSWTATSGGVTFGPYPLGSQSDRTDPLLYPVQQAQVEVTGWR